LKVNRYHLIISRAFALLLLIVLTSMGVALAIGSAYQPTVLPTDWPAYMDGGPHQSFNTSDTTINPQTAASLRPIWVKSTGNVIVSAPAIADGAVYIGNWISGTNFFKLDANTGQTLWGANLDHTQVINGCDPPSAGVSSGPAIYSNTVYVGGGGNWFYALNTADGSTRWRFNTAFRNDNTYNGTYNWASPMVYSGSVYMGVASFGDCPLVQGRLLQLDANSGALLHQFKVVPDGQVGGGVWNSP
jgi:outer membrane protein assembly factor BamB